MLVTFVIDTSASMNQTTSNGMTLLDYAKSAVERFIKRLRDPVRRHQHHFMLVSCGLDNRKANAQVENATSFRGRVRVGWDQSTNKDFFMQEMKNLQATEVSDLGMAIKQAFELMNQVRLQYNWDNYGLGRTPWNTNVSACILLTDAAGFTTAEGLPQASLFIPSSHAVAADLTKEPYRWDQRFYTIALKLSASNSHGKSQSACLTQLMALAEATGGTLYAPTSKHAVEQSVDQIMLKLKNGAVINLKAEAAENEANFTTRTTICPIPNGKDYNWPIPESFWIDRNTSILQPRDAHPTLTFVRTIETAIEAATSHMLLDTLRFPADSYSFETPIDVSPPRGHHWMVYVEGSRGDDSLGDPIGFIRTVSSGTSASVLIVLLPYNYPALFTLLVDIARVYQTSGQSVTSSNGSWQFQSKSMPSTWRENFSAYINRCPIYYHAALRKALSIYNLQDMVPEVQDFGRNYQISAYLNCAREQSILENEKYNKINAVAARTAVPRSKNFHNDSRLDASPTKSLVAAQSTKHSSKSDALIDNVGLKSIDEMLAIHARTHLYQQVPSAKSHHLSQSMLLSSQLSSTSFSSMKGFSLQEDDKHSQPIDVMSDYESRLISKEALRNPLGEPEVDEDTLTGLRRRQLCFNLGNPYKKSTFKQQQVSNAYQGEAADEAATLKGQPSKRNRTRRRFSHMNRMHVRRTNRQSDSPSRSLSPGSPTGSPGYTPSFEGSPSPGHRDMENSMMYETKSLDSMKTDIAFSLGISPSSDELGHVMMNASLSQQVYHILVENWETWNAVLRLLRARSISQQEEGFILSALRSMKGGQSSTRAYIQQAISHTKAYKKTSLMKKIASIQPSD